MQHRLISLEWPEFGGPASAPVFNAEDFQQRLQRTRRAMDAAGLTHLLVYGDREHFANLLWLCGLDPRFEEALLVLGPRDTPLLLTGIECQAYVNISPLYGAGQLRQEHFLPFSLPNITRAETRGLAEILGEEGLAACARVGVAGWKALDLPHYLMSEIAATGARTIDAAPLFIDAERGLRTRATAQEIAWLEYSNVLASEAMKRVLRGIRLGATDHELVALAGYNGVPQGCHWGLKTGAHRVSLASPRGAVVERGQPLSGNVCYWGSNCCRAGWVVEGDGEVPGYVREFAGPYFEAMGAWFAALDVGRPAGDLDAAIRTRLDAAAFGIKFAAGHLIHFEEWLNSPVWEGSEIPLHAGMVFQSDVIPGSARHYSTRMEDSYALVDAALEQELARDFPEVHARCLARRRFMRETLGLPVTDTTLPLSNLAGIVPPYLLRLDQVLALR